MPLLTRTASWLSRRLGRPELLAAVNVAARTAARDEVAIKAVIAAVLDSDSSYVDVGVNRGQILSEALRVAPRGRHVAFEPIPGLAEGVSREFPDVECRRKALGARAESAEFCHFKRLDGWSGLRRNGTISDRDGDPEYITVAVSTLDAELRGLTPRLLKIDVEGAELEVLRGGEHVLSQSRPVVVFEHVRETAALYGATSHEIWDLLYSLGYRIFSAVGDGPFGRADFADAVGVVNWLATPD